MMEAAGYLDTPAAKALRLLSKASFFYVFMPDL